MMLAQSRSPETLSNPELDAYLARGWFRMGQTIFTTNFLRYQGQLYSTLWLRVSLDHYQPDTTQLKLSKRNAGFRTVIQPAVLTPEKEELYLRYQQSLPFPTSESLRHLLLNDSDVPSIYNTYEVAIYLPGQHGKGDKLIAIGFFDLGETSAEGIVSVYDPAYKKHSLGKYLIYQKIKYCQQMGLHFFYPGYFVPGNPNFDYKLSIGRPALQFLQLRTQRWLSIDAFSEDNIPMLMMRNKLAELQNLLTKVKVRSKVVNYEYFDAGLIPDLREADLLDFPVFLYGDTEPDQLSSVVVYDVRDNYFHLLMCIPFWKPDNVSTDSTFYSAYVLKPLHELYATARAEEMVVVFRKSLAQMDNP